MRVAVYSLTRDRLEYTKHCFKTLQEKAGFDYDHFIYDNGSDDGTAEWLRANKSNFKRVIYSAVNKGISVASNEILDDIFLTEKSNGIRYDLIIKFDNDCEVISENIIGQIVEIYQSLEDFSPAYVLSPRVEGINNQPSRGRFVQIAGRRVGLTSIVGGLFHVVQRRVYKNYRYNTELPKAWGQDDEFCHFVKRRGGEVGYIEGLIVNHYKGTDGQAVDYPAYFERKRLEEGKTNE